MPNVYVDLDTHRRLKKLANERNSPIGEIIRTSVGLSSRRLYKTGSSTGRSAKYPWLTMTEGQVYWLPGHDTPRHKATEQSLRTTEAVHGPQGIVSAYSAHGLLWIKKPHTAVLRAYRGMNEPWTWMTEHCDTTHWPVASPFTLKGIYM